MNLVANLLDTGDRSPSSSLALVDPHACRDRLRHERYRIAKKEHGVGLLLIQV
ncbi:MAG: hypothetical protein OJF51_004218 [Nitrospira sp.]|nr:MAG: hypothetical protein OJF51_004218 [Nitrospira sp.]